ncbi:glycosyltransferase family 4 protein [bacterium]
MRILFLTQYFPPEVGAASARAYETAMYLRSWGYKISVLTTFPNYLHSKPTPGYKNKLFMHEKMDGIKVFRVFSLFSFGKGICSRFFTFLTFMLTSILKGLALEKHDILIASSPPFSMGLAGLFLSRCKKVKFVFEVRDLYPDSAVALQVLRNRGIIYFLHRIEKYLYRKADRVIALTEGLQKHIAQYTPPEKTVLITNGVHLDLFLKKVKLDYDFFKKDLFVLLNVGILGRVHGLETILEALAILQNDRLCLVFAGGGVEEKKLKKQVQMLKLPNIFFLNSVPRGEIPELIRSSHICLVTTKNLQLTRSTLPVKLFEYMACGKPVIAAVHGEAAEIMRKSQCGIVVEPENAHEMAQAIDILYKSAAKRKRMGARGRHFVIEHFNREYLSRTYEAILNQLFLQ